jgi:hypothetical protein
MDYLCLERILRHRETPGEGVERAAIAWVGAMLKLRPTFIPANPQLTCDDILFPEGANLNGEVPRQCTAEILDVDTGAAIDVRRVFVRKESNALEICHETSR